MNIDKWIIITDTVVFGNNEYDVKTYNKALWLLSRTPKTDTWSDEDIKKFLENSCWIIDSDRLFE